MINRTTKLRWRRHLKRSKRQVEDLSVQAEEQLERHLFRRLSRLYDVRRFVFAWTGLVVLLIGGVVIQTRSLSNYYQTLKPAPGGTFTEGVVGVFTNANPLYASSPVDSSVARLVFSGLMRYDQKGRLLPDLAEKWSVNERGTTYTIVLRKNLTWHDGKPLTAADVVFTYKTIQNPDSKSPLLNSWKGIRVTAKNPYTIIFTLPNALSSFPHSLTNGIIPKHWLVDIPAAQLRSVRFNTANPIGSGPFKWETIEVEGENPEEREERIGLVPNENFYRGAPKLQRFIIRGFHDEQKLLKSLESRELNGVVGLETLPDTLSHNQEIRSYNIPINGEVMAFFKTSQPILSDRKVRLALVKAINVPEIVERLGYPAVVVDSPLLPSQTGYNKKIVQLSQNVKEANKLLDQAGWKTNQNNIREHKGQKLSLQLISQNTSDYTTITQALKEQWQAIGVDIQDILQSDADLQQSISEHSYDILLYGIALGPDPDVFPYWHSSQADPRSANRLNLSEYKSKQADTALEAGRTRSNPKLRAVKYRPFLEAWRNDAPALALYKPRFLYVSFGNIFGFEPKVINSAVDRYANVENWMILEEKTNK